MTEHITPDDYETRVSLARLNTASAEITQQDRDRVLAFVAGNMWTLAKLDDRITFVHNNLCASCPLRQQAAPAEPKADRVAQILQILKIVLFITAVLALIVAALHGVKVPAGVTP